MGDNLPVKANADRALVGEIAMDIGKSAVSYLRVMYPDVYAAMNSGCRLSLRNHIHNEIMDALDTTDADEIKRRLQERRAFRRRQHAVWDKIRSPLPPMGTESGSLAAESECDALREALAAEREACAAFVEAEAKHLPGGVCDLKATCRYLANEIRARALTQETADVGE